METANVKIPFGLAVVLSEVVELLLHAVDANGKVVPRKLPFRLHYRLNRNKTALDRDVKFFTEKKMYLLAKYGTITEDGKNVEIKDPEKLKKYTEEVNALIETPVSHNIITMEMEDLDKVTDEVAIPSEAMKLFIGYMTNDDVLWDELLEDIKFKIKTDAFEEGIKVDTEVSVS